MDQLAAIHLPDRHRSIFTSAGQQRALRIERQASDRLALLFEGTEQFHTSRQLRESLVGSSRSPVRPFRHRVSLTIDRTWTLRVERTGPYPSSSDRNEPSVNQQPSKSGTDHLEIATT